MYMFNIWYNVCKHYADISVLQIGFTIEGPTWLKTGGLIQKSMDNMQHFLLFQYLMHLRIESLGPLTSKNSLSYILFYLRFVSPKMHLEFSVAKPVISIFSNIQEWLCDVSASIVDQKVNGTAFLYSFTSSIPVTQVHTHTVHIGALEPRQLIRNFTGG